MNIICCEKLNTVNFLEVRDMPIAIAPKGEELLIRRVGADDKIKKRLREMGIFEGSKITLLSSDGGNVIVIVKEGRLCLDKALAGKILVA